MPNFSQHHIKSQIISYLIQQKRDPLYIEQLNKHGLCKGFTSLFLYAKWLEYQPQRKNSTNQIIARDDLTWLNKALSTISTWDKKSPLTKEEEECFEGVLAKIYAYQNKFKFLPISENDFHLFFEDTKNRVCKLEYSLGARFTLNEFAKCLPDLLHENKLIFISSDDHSMGIIKKGNMLSFLDSNLEYGMIDIDLSEKAINPINELARDIAKKYLKLDDLTLSSIPPDILPLIILFYDGSDYDCRKPSPIDVQIFGIYDQKEAIEQTFHYPPVEYFLDQVACHQMPYQTDHEGYARNFTELHLAAMLGSTELIDYFLKQPIAKDPRYLDHVSKFGTALLIAIEQSHPNVAKALLKAGADPNFAYHYKTPLLSAILRGNLEMVKALVEAGANVNQLTQDNLSPLTCAAGPGTLSTLEEKLKIIDYLIQKKADINLINPSGMTALAYAVSDGLDDQIISPLITRGATCTGIELMLALRENKDQLVTQFLKCGANLHRALMYAADIKDHAIMAKLIQLGAQPYQASILAVETSTIDAIKTLIENDQVKQFIQECGIHSLLLFAVQNNQPKAMMQLLHPNLTPPGGWETWISKAHQEGIDIIKFGLDIIENVFIKNIMVEYEKNKSSLWWRFFSEKTNEKKLMAADALANALKEMDNPNKTGKLKNYMDVLTSTLKEANELFNAIYEITFEEKNSFKKLGSVENFSCN